MRLQAALSCAIGLMLTGCAAGDLTAPAKQASSPPRMAQFSTVYGNEPREPAYYNGAIYYFTISSATSGNQRELSVGCFNLGPAAVDSNPHVPTATLYALFVNGATMHTCSPGDAVDEHDHLLSAVPGTPGYHPDWQLVIVTEVDPSNPLLSIIPIRSVADLHAAEAANLLVESPAGINVKASVVGIP